MKEKTIVVKCTLALLLCVSSLALGQQPPTMTMKFEPSALPLGEETALTFTLYNGNGASLNGVALIDSLPTGLVVSHAMSGFFCSPGGAGLGQILAQAGSNAIHLNGTVPSHASCTFSVAVKGIATGVMNNSVTVSAQQTGAATNTATASLTVLAPPQISMAFGADSIKEKGSTRLTFTLSNPNSSAVPNVTFTDSLPAGLVVATPSGLANSCNGSMTANAGSSTISLSSPGLPQSKSCTVALNVTATTAGAKQNSVTIAFGGTPHGSTTGLPAQQPVAGNTATATLNVTGSADKTLSSPGTVVSAHPSNFFQLAGNNAPQGRFELNERALTAGTISMLARAVIAGSETVVTVGEMEPGGAGGGERAHLNGTMILTIPGAAPGNYKWTLPDNSATSVMLTIAGGSGAEQYITADCVPHGAAVCNPKSAEGVTRIISYDKSTGELSGEFEGTVVKLVSGLPSSYSSVYGSFRVRVQQLGMTTR